MSSLPADPALDWFPVGASDVPASQAAKASPLLARVHRTSERGRASCILCASYSSPSVGI